MITYHHIGGRNGTFPIPVQETRFSQDIHLVLYEADLDCIDQILQAENSAFGKVSVHPYCIAKEKAAGHLNINFHPTTNSLYAFNQKYQDYTCVAKEIYGEYRLGDACKPITQMPIHLLSLEDALAKAGLQEIDFLSLDIQGVEYDVLNGAKTLIQEKCLGIQLEVEFAKIYEGQSSFFDINTLMDSMGFELIEIKNFGRYAPISMPIGFRGTEQPLYAEAIYIKKFDELLKYNDAEMLYKWALFGLINKKIGLCLKALDALPSLPQKPDLDKFQYISLLKKIGKLYQEEKFYKLPNLSELFSQEILSGFYQGIPNDSSQFNETNKAIQEALKTKYLPLLPKVELLAKENNTPFELLLRQYGLPTIANAVKENRLRESACFLKLIRSIANTEKNWRSLWTQESSPL